MKDWILRNRFKVMLVFVLFVVSANMLFWYQKKEGFMVDEMLTFGLANSSYLPFLHFSDTEDDYTVHDFMQDYGYGDTVISLMQNVWNDASLLVESKFHFKDTVIYEDYLRAQSSSANAREAGWTSGEYYKEYLIVGKEQSFDPFSVLYNQKNDVHPPLYYLLLHALSSMVPGTYPFGMAMLLNAIFMIAALIAFDSLLDAIVPRNWMTLLTVAIYGLSVPFLSTVLLYRMYAMLTFFTLALCKEVYVYCQEEANESDILQKKKRVKWMFVWLVAGYLTHYYFLVYAFFLMFVAMIRLLVTNKTRKAFTLALVSLGAGVAGLLFWPFGYDHIFMGYRGKEAYSALTALGSGVDKMVAVAKRCFLLLFAGNWLVLLVFLLLLGALVLLLVHHTRITKEHLTAEMLLFLPPALSFGVVTVASSISDERYVANLVPFVYLLFGSLLVRAANTFFWDMQDACKKEQRRKEYSKSARGIRPILGAIFCGWLLVSLPIAVSPSYVSEGGALTEEVPKESVCICVLPENSWNKSVEHVYLMSQCREVLVIYPSQWEVLREYVPTEGDTVYLYVDYSLLEFPFLEEIQNKLHTQNLSMIETRYAGYAELTIWK